MAAAPQRASASQLSLQDGLSLCDRWSKTATVANPTARHLNYSATSTLGWAGFRFRWRLVDPEGIRCFARCLATCGSLSSTIASSIFFPTFVGEYSSWMRCRARFPRNRASSRRSYTSRMSLAAQSIEGSAHLWSSTPGYSPSETDINSNGTGYEHSPSAKSAVPE
jgi:hypothetical protein